MLSANDVLHKPLAVASTNATSADVTSGVACRVMSITLTSVLGAGTATVYNNTSASGDAIVIECPAGGDTRQVEFGPQGIYFDTGLTIVGGSALLVVVAYMVDP